MTARVATLNRALHRVARAYPGGIDWVIVSGVVVVDGGEQTGALAGRVLRRR